MNKLLQSLKEVWLSLDRSIYTGERYKSNMNALFLVSLVSAGLGLILIALNLKGDDPMMFFASILTFVSGVLCAVFVRVLKKREIAIMIAVAFCFFMISFYVLSAAGEGSAILWTLLVPIGISYFVKVKYGIILSAYYTVLISVIFYSPLRERYLLYYNPEFMKRFPLLYACLSIFTCMAMLQAGRR